MRFNPSFSQVFFMIFNLNEEINFKVNKNNENNNYNASYSLVFGCWPQTKTWQACFPKVFLRPVDDALLVQELERKQHLRGVEPGAVDVEA